MRGTGRSTALIRLSPPQPRSGPVQRAQDSPHGGQLDIGIHPGAPAGAAVAVLDLDVGDGRRLFAGAQCVLAVIGDLEARHARSAEPVDQRGQRAVAFAGKTRRACRRGAGARGSGPCRCGSRFRSPEAARGRCARCIRARTCPSAQRR